MATAPKDTHSATPATQSKNEPPASPSSTSDESARDKARADRQARMKDAPPIIDEQRQRSAEIETMGVSEWMREHDDRPDDQKPVLHKGVLPIGDTLDTPPEKQKQVKGVSTPVKDDGTGKPTLHGG